MSHVKSIYVIGAGGHAKVVIRALQDSGCEAAMIFDDAPERQGATLLEIPIVGPIERILEYPSHPTVIAVGNNAVRHRIAKKYDLPWMTIVHPRAMIDHTVSVGRGTVVLAGVVIQVDSSIGDHAIINHAATVDHDCRIESFAHLAPGVHLSGEVTVCEGAFVGVGAVAIPGVHIGTDTTVGAGAAVVCNLPAGVIAAGVPARIIRRSLSVSQCRRRPTEF